MGSKRKAQRGGVETPYALEQKYPQVGNTLGWFWMFPSPTLSIDPRSGVEIYTHVLKVAAGGTAAPLDALLAGV